MSLTKYKDIALSILKELISIQSFSKEENHVADLMEKKLDEFGYQVNRVGNNVWVFNKDFKEGRPVLLMNSHLDTVKPNEKWSKDPFTPEEIEGKLFGLGSNDAGGCLVSLMATFLALEETQQDYNRVFCASAEEEISGKNGFELVQDKIGRIDVGIVGEPTLMEMAIAEKGLMVLDCEAKGVPGHAARNEGVNAIGVAMNDIEWFHTFQFENESEMLGPVKMTVTQINAGKQHNVIPASCTYVVDVRTNEFYSNEKAFEIIEEHVESTVRARSFRMNSSGISLEHPLIKKGLKQGMKYYGSPTTSDQAIMKGFPTLKLGPGDSARSHTADEFIYIKEIGKGIEKYYNLLNGLEI
ncbi:M20 family metallo-hydrolase [Marinifilum caeruleilacunae]|uniref:M20/M25/M40 family metallo-hydrolase n=1 Tax=Marinifilum caeruleilacunae TaxID=2499076 RepID=A0ABX1WQ34_9BACT|nr:M20 family metallo-hydrolase [Marinifilum caeruleilacunae]NOU58196.1 M20/M25/M40 family metallo-hydrolase [Marinifilum caeruleilacunae]